MSEMQIFIQSKEGKRFPCEITVVDGTALKVRYIADETMLVDCVVVERDGEEMPMSGTVTVQWWGTPEYTRPLDAFPLVSGEQIDFEVLLAES